jgi:hypothetical protein
VEVADALLERRVRLPEVGLHHAVQDGQDLLDLRSSGSSAALEAAVTRAAKAW